MESMHENVIAMSMWNALLVHNKGFVTTLKINGLKSMARNFIEFEREVYTHVLVL